MPTLPERANLAHLRKQAKDLLSAYRAGDSGAIERFRLALPAAQALTADQIAASHYRLHDAQSCVAREYGFNSWSDLKTWVESARQALTLSRDKLMAAWLVLVYGRGFTAPRPGTAVRLLESRPEIDDGEPLTACAIGDVARIEAALSRDPLWLERPDGPFEMPPLIAVTHSSLIRLPEYAPGLLAAAELLLDHGAQHNTTYLDPQFPDSPLSALYGAAGKNHHVELTRLLLARGADPNDGESLYHSLESADLACTRLLLDAGVRVPGTNALRKVLDFDRFEGLRLLLEHGADPNEPGEWPVLLWAIRRGRSLEHIRALLEAGADPHATAPDGKSAYRTALAYGLTEVAIHLRTLTNETELGSVDRFIAACAEADLDQARHLLVRYPDIFSQMTAAELRMLPELAALGRTDAVRTMVEVGWPIDVPGGDWQASALNLAVFNGDPALTRFLLSHGARWDVPHGHNDTVIGTLSWASLNAPTPEGDWLGCAEALVEGGVPLPRGDYYFSAEVTSYLKSVGWEGPTPGEPSS